MIAAASGVQLAVMRPGNCDGRVSSILITLATLYVPKTQPSPGNSQCLPIGREGNSHGVSRGQRVQQLATGALAYLNGSSPAGRCQKLSIRRQRQRTNLPRAN